MGKNLIGSLLIFFYLFGFAQTNIPILKKGGVYEVSCQVNGKDAKFIFDSGAADVQLSKEFFNEGLKNGLFRLSDLYADVVEYKVASGEVVTGRNVNIRHLKIGNLSLYNVVGSIIDSPNTPMLLGQSAIERFGAYSIDYTKMMLTVNGNSTSKVEGDLIAQSKKPGMETMVGAKLKALKILPELEFEVVSINTFGDGAVHFKVDITNNSNLDYSTSGGAIIDYMVEVTTEDGKRYTSSNVPILLTILSGQTGNSIAMMNIRGKKPIRLRIISKLQGYW